MQMASYLLSPMIFRQKQESRFQFAHSVDPIKSQCDLDEIEVPARIQDLIERNIRTLSNSMSKSELERLDLKDIKEKWLTKKEMLIQIETSARNRNIGQNASATDES